MNNPQTSEVNIAGAPSLAAVRQLLSQAGLPDQDLSQADMQRFLYLGRPDLPLGVIGLEQYESVGLLRSLAIRSDARGNNYGSALVQALENEAKRLGIATLYLLALDSDRYFARLGYSAIKRSAAPSQIANTAQFSDLCPISATLMSKTL